MNGFARCAAVDCWTAASVERIGVQLCPSHDRQLRGQYQGLQVDHAKAMKLLGWTPYGPSVVYYVAWRSRPDHIKIGTTSNLHQRMNTLSKMNDPARCLAAEIGAYDLEMRRHRQFKSFRLPGTELFRWTDQLRHHVLAVRAETGWHGDPKFDRMAA